jgi:hypothetical protein
VSTNPMTELESHARAYREARDVLMERAQVLYDELEAVKRKRLTGLRNAVAKVTETEAALTSSIKEHAGLFSKPKTRVLAGVKLGFQKAKGKMSWAKADQVVKLIRKHFPEQADVLIRSKDEPVKDALANLAAADLKRLGVTVKETGDEVVIKDTTAPVDKLVDALLKGASAEAEAEED